MNKLETKYTLGLLEGSGSFILNAYFHFNFNLSWKTIHMELKKKKFPKRTKKKQRTQMKHTDSLRHKFSDLSRYFISVKNVVLWEIRGFHFESEHI